MPFCVFGQQTKQKYPLPLAKYNDNVKMPLTPIERAQIIEAYGAYADEYVFSNPHRLKSIKHTLRNRVVIKLITPLTALGPYSALEGPRTTSILSSSPRLTGISQTSSSGERRKRRAGQPLA